MRKKDNLTDTEMKDIERMRDVSDSLGQIIRAVPEESDFYDDVNRLNNFFPSVYQQRNDVYKILAEGVLTEAIRQPYKIESEGNWYFLSKLTSDEYASQNGVPETRKERIEKRKDFQSRLMDASDRSVKLTSFLSSQKYLKSQSPLNPKSAYLAALTPYELSVLADQVVDLYKTIQIGPPSRTRDRVMSDLAKTRSEIAISMQERLSLTKAGNPADLAAQLDSELKPSPVYGLSNQDVREYIEFINRYGDDETKQKITELGSALDILYEKERKTNVTMTDYLQNRFDSEAAIAYAAACDLAKIIFGLPQPPPKLDRHLLREINAEIKFLETQLKQSEESLSRIPWKTIAFRKVPSEITAQKKEKIAQLKQNALEVEKKYEDYSKSIRKEFSPLKIAGGEWAKRIESQKKQLADAHENLRSQTLLKTVKIDKRVQIAQSSLDRFKKAGAIRRFFMSRWPFDGDEKKRTAELQDAKTALAIEDNKLLKETEKLVEKNHELDASAKEAVRYVVAEIRNEVINRGSPVTKEEMDAVKKFVNTHDPSLNEKLNRNLDFVGRFILGIHTEASVDNLNRIANDLSAVQPDLKIMVDRVMSLLEGNSQYHSKNPIDELKKDILTIDQHGYYKGEIKPDELYETIKENYLNPILTEENNAERLESLLAFYSPDEQKMIMKNRLSNIGDLTKTYFALEKNLDKAKQLELDYVAKNKVEQNIKLCKSERSKAEEAFINTAQHFGLPVSEETELWSYANWMMSENPAADRTFSEDDIAKKFLNLKSQDQNKIKEAAKAYLAADMKLTAANKADINVNQAQSRFNDCAEQLYAAIPVLSGFKNVEGYDLQRNALFQFFYARLDKFLDPKAVAYTDDDFDKDDQLFELARQTKRNDERASVIETYFQERLSARLASDPKPNWNPYFARLVERYADSELAHQYRLLGIQQYIEAARNNLSIEAQQAFIENFEMAVEQGKYLMPDMADDKLILDLTEDKNPTFMHEMLVRKFGTKEQLQNMRARWILNELQSLSDPERPASSEFIVRHVFKDIKRSNFKEYVGHANAESIGKEVKALTDTIIAQRKNKFSQSDEGRYFNQTELSQEIIDDVIRLMGGEVGEKLLDIFSISDAVDEQIMEWKTQRDADQLARGFEEEIKYGSTVSKKQMTTDDTVVDELLKSVEERKDERELKRVEALPDYVSDSDLETVSEDILEQAHVKKYEFNYHDKPDTFYTHYLLKVQSVCEMQLRDNKIKEAFLRTDESGNVVSPDQIMAEFTEFKLKYVEPVASFDERHVTPIITKLKDCRFDSDTFSDKEALNNALLELGKGDSSVLYRCEEWCEKNRDKPGVDAVGSYILACRNAANINALMTAAYACLVIEDAVGKLITGQNVGDIGKIIADNFESFSKMPFLRARITPLLQNLIDHVKSVAANNAYYNPENTQKIAAIIEQFGNAAQKKELDAIQEAVKLFDAHHAKNREQLSALLGEPGREEFNKLKAEKIEKHVVTPSYKAPQAVKIKTERGDSDTIKIMNQKLRACLLTARKNGGYEFQDDLMRKIGTFLNTHEKNAFRDEQVKIIDEYLTPEEKILIKVKRFFKVDGQLKYDEVTKYGREFHEAMKDYQKLPVHKKDAKIELGLRNAIDLAKTTLNALLDSSFHDSPYFFGSDASSREDIHHRMEEKEKIVALYQLLKATGGKEAVKQYDDQLQNFILPHFLQHVVYHDQLPKVDAAHDKHFRYALFESLYRVSELPDPDSLSYFSEHRHDPAKMHVEFLASAKNPESEFVAHCAQAWGKLSLEQVMNLEDGGINFDKVLVAQAQKEAREIIGPKNVTVKQAIEIERKCYLDKLEIKVSSMPPSDEKDKLVKHLLSERKSLRRPDDTGKATQSASPAPRY